MPSSEVLTKQTKTNSKSEEKN